MTHERTEYLISKILDSPDRLTDSEILEVTSDAYLRKLYDTASLLKSASAPSLSYNLDSEWRALQARLTGEASAPPVGRSRGWRWDAAIIVGIILCGAIVALLFRTGGHRDSDVIAEEVVDSIDAQRAVALPVADNEAVAAADTIKSMKANGACPAMPAGSPSVPDHLAQAKSDETNGAGPDFPLPSVQQALILTDEDMMMAQMILASYDAALYDNSGCVTTVNYGDRAPQSAWLHEFMKYASALAGHDISIRRGSANMLYRLSYSTTGVIGYDRQTALAEICSLLDDGICDSDALVLALVSGCRDNLR